MSYCNQRCIFCGVDFARQKKHKLDTETTAKRLREMGEWGIKSIMYAGEGEPLLHPDLPLLVRTARESDIDVSITSNGTLGKQSIWEKLIPNLTWLRFSVDAGSPEVYSQVHGVPLKALTRTVQSVAEALEVRERLNLKTTIGVQFVILEENRADLAAALELWSSLGVDYISLKPFSQHPQMLNKKEVNYYARLIDEVDEVVKEYQARVTTPIVFRREALINYQARGQRFDCCHALPFWGYISSRGDFHTCSVYLGDDRFNVGNINKQDMGEILFGERRRKSVDFGRQGLDVKKECRVNCRMARINEFLAVLVNKPQHINFI